VDGFADFANRQRPERAAIPNGGREDRHAHSEGHVAAGRLPHGPARRGRRRLSDRHTAYLKNSGKLEIAQYIANHESPAHEETLRPPAG
jgi:hypothetical protein